MFEALWQDIRYAARSLRRTPGFTCAAVITLALAIGASIAMFKVVDATLLRPLSFPQAEQLTAVWERPPAGAAWTRQTVPYALFEDWVREARSFSGLAGVSPYDFALSTPNGPLRVSGSVVTRGFFGVLGVVPAPGLELSNAVSLDEQSVIVSNALWRQHFGSDPDVTGRLLDLDGVSYRVVAVLPRGLAVPSVGPQPDVWIQASSANRPPRLMVVGRLRDGIEPAAAEAELAAMQRARGSDATGVLVRPLQGDAAELSKPTLAVLSLAVALLLLIACANLASMLLERIFMRRRELAVRTSVGATGRRLATQLTVEQVILWSCAGLAGVALGTAFLRALLEARGLVFLEGVVPELIVLDRRALLFATVITSAGALLFGVVPAIVSSRANSMSMLRSGASPSGTRTRARRVIVACEVALAVALLVNAGLLIASYNRLATQPVGVRDTGYVTLRLQLPQTRYGEHLRRVAFHDALLRELRVLPGVETAGAASARPLGGVPVGPFEVDAPATVAGGTPLGGIEAADPEFFRAAGVPVLAGRVFEASDQATNAIAIINQTLSRRFFGGESGVGKRIRFGPPRNQTPWMTIVGVVGDVRHAGLDWEILPEIYVPYPQASNWGLAFITADLHVVIRHRAGVSIPTKAIHDAVWSVDRTLPVTELTTYSGLISDATARPEFRMALVSVLASLALLLSAVGLFGVLSFVVGRRQSEIGIRIAVGANRLAVVRLVLTDMGVLTLCGIAAGIPIAWTGSRVVESLLFGVRSTDPGPYVTAAIVILVTALIAAAFPAARASRIDPVAALRAE